MTKKLNTGNTSTPYDDAYRTLLTDCPELIIPLVNEVFHKNHGTHEKVTIFNNEFYFTLPNSEQTERITDSHFAINETEYHMECVSSTDGTIAFRLFEYDSKLALKYSHLSQNELKVRFPNSALIYLRHTKNTPNVMKMTIEVPSDSCSYDIPILKVKNYTLEEIFEKKLFFLIPFHLFTYENQFKEYNNNAQKLQELTKHYSELMKALDTYVEKRFLSNYAKRSIVAMTQKVMKHLTTKYANVQEGLGEIMGGKILEYEAKDILRQGIEQGKEQKLIVQITKKLRKHQSVEQIAEALEESMEYIQEMIKKYNLS